MSCLKRSGISHGFGDAVRPDTQQAIDQLKRTGWDIGMVSGDHPQVVKRVAEGLGLAPDDTHGNIMPEQKVEMVQRYRGRGPVVMVGDGVNDAAALAAADVLVHLSWHDSFGFAVLEAMASGLPVVTSGWAGAAELIEPGISGFVVDPTDEKAIRRTLDTLSDHETRARVGAAAHTVAGRYGEEPNFARMEALFELAAGRRGGQ